MVYACDVSSKRIELVRKYAGANELSDRIHAVMMPEERMTHEDEFFDFVFVNASLHHCDVEKTIAQIVWVLKNGGKAAIIEDYSYHPVLRMYRRIMKSRHTQFEGSLEDRDLALIEDSFTSVELQPTGLLNFLGARKKMPRLLDRIDDILLRLLPGLRRYYRIVRIFAQK